MQQEGEKRIVIVEPNVKVRGPLFKYLKTLYGYMVKVAKSGRDGMQKVRKYEPHLVMIDKELPDMSWKTVTEKMRQKNPSLCIIVTGESFSDDDRRFMTRNKGYSWLERPYPMGDLVPKIELMFKVWLRTRGPRRIRKASEESETRKTGRRVRVSRKEPPKGRKVRIKTKEDLEVEEVEEAEEAEEVEVLREPVRELD